MRIRQITLLICWTAASVSIAQDGPPPAWKLRGALAAWGDTSPRVRAQALDQLRALKSVSILDRREVEALLDSSDAAVQASAIRTLGEMHAADLRPRFLEFVDSFKRDAANQNSDKEPAACASIEALAAIKAPEATSLALDAFRQSRISGCMERAGEAALETLKSPDIVTHLAAMIKGGDHQADAAVLMGKIGTKDQVPLLMAHFRDKSNYSFDPFLKAVGDLNAVNQIPRIIPLLADKEDSIRAGAVEALGAMGDPALEPLIAKGLDDTNDSVKAAACEALGELKAINYAPRIYATFIVLSKGDGFDAGECLRALGNMGAKDYVPEIAANLKNQLGFIANYAAEALVQLEARDQVGKIIDAEKDPRSAPPFYPSIDIRPLEPVETVQLLSYIYDETARSDELRAIAHLDGGGLQENEDLVTWLGSPPAYPTDDLDRTRALRTLSTFCSVWSAASKRPRLLNDMEEQAALIIKTVGIGWRTEDIPELTKVEKLMRASGNKQGLSTRADAVSSVISGIKAKEWGLQLGAFLGIHATFWAAFLWLYPRYAPVRAVFFWNPWVRKIGGLGYVGVLLTWVPFLRRRLFEPFRAALIEDAGISSFNRGEAKDLNYFPDSDVKLDSGECKPIIAELREFNGRIVVEGESGLGKTMFLRHLISESKRLCVFLPASKCESGVIESIEAMLQGIPRDTGFLRSLIYSGTMDVIIDGLNEVGPNTVANVRSFLSSNTAGNIIVATQPIDWKIPSGVTHLVIQPLSPASIRAFLRSRRASLGNGALVTGDAYEHACDGFVNATLDDTNGPTEAFVAQRVLSNPMDLSVVSLMLSMGADPNLAALQEQQYCLMAADYSHINGGREFPLATFSSHVFEMRLSDTPELTSDEMLPELPVLEAHKMVYKRVFLNGRDETTKWYFRHDKIIDFFLLQVFMRDPSKQEQYMNDARFRGVYFLLARFLPLEDANLLRERLVDEAVDRSDHTVSDGFIKALRERHDRLATGSTP